MTENMGEESENILSDIRTHLLKIERAKWPHEPLDKMVFDTLQQLQADNPENTFFGPVGISNALSEFYNFLVLSRFNKMSQKDEPFGYRCSSQQCSLFVPYGPRITLLPRDSKIIPSIFKYSCRECGYDISYRRRYRRLRAR